MLWSASSPACRGHRPRRARSPCLVVERAFPLTRSRLATVAALGVVALGAGLLLWVLPALLGFAGGMTPEVASVLAADGRPPVTLRVPGTPTPLVGRALN